MQRYRELSFFPTVTLPTLLYDVKVQQGVDLLTHLVFPCLGYGGILEWLHGHLCMGISAWCRSGVWLPWSSQGGSDEIAQLCCLLQVELRTEGGCARSTMLRHSNFTVLSACSVTTARIPDATGENALSMFSGVSAHVEMLP